MPQEPILEPGPVEPIHIVPATTPLEEPVAMYEPTQVIPQVPYRPVQPVAPVAPVAAVAPVAPVAAPPIVYDRRPAWPYFVAALALLLGGVVGFLIGNARQTDQTDLTSSTQPLDSVVDSTASVADLQNQVALLTAAQAKSAQDLADAQAALTQAQADRDALATQVSTAGGTQADLDAANAQVAKLQTDLQNATTQLDAANASLAQTQADLKTAQGQLDAANATLTQLHPTPLANYVNGAVTKVRSDAQANGWTIIEEPGSSATAAPGTVLEQSPAPNTTMVTGSVILVKVK